MFLISTLQPIFITWFVWVPRVISAIIYHLFNIIDNLNIDGKQTVALRAEGVCIFAVLLCSQHWDLPGRDRQRCLLLRDYLLVTG